MAEKPFNSVEIANALDEDMEFVLTELGKSVHRTVVFASPVGDPTLWQNPGSAPEGYVGGTFRSSWLVGVGSPPQAKASAVESVGQTLQKGAIVLEAQVRNDGKSIFIVNNQPYSTRLNAGHSTQAPAGFVEQAVADGVLGVLPGSRVLR